MVPPSPLMAVTNYHFCCPFLRVNMRCCQPALLIEGEKTSAINGKCSNRQQNRRTSPSTELWRAGRQAFFVTFRVAFLFFVPCFFLFNGRWWWWWWSRGDDFLKTGKPSFYPKLGGSVGSVGAPVRTKVGGRLLMTQWLRDKTEDHIGHVSPFSSVFSFTLRSPEIRSNEI